MDGTTVEEIFMEIAYHPGITKKRIQEKYALDDRKIEYYLKKVNELLQNLNYPPLTRRKNHLWMSLNEEEVLNLISEIRYNKTDVINKNHRLLLIPLIIFSNRHMTFQKLANKLKVSKNTAINDIKSLRKDVDFFEYSFTRKEGFMIIGNEYEIRTNIMRYLYKLMNYNWTSELMSPIVGIELNTLYVYKEFIVKLEKELQTQFSSYQIELLSLFISCLFKRIDNGFYLKSGTKYSKIQIELEDDESFKKMLDAIYKFKLSPKLSTEDYKFLAIQFLSANVIKSEWHTNSALANMVETVIDLFEVKYIIHFSKEERIRLKDMLYQHILPAIYRLKYGTPYEDYDIERVVKKYSDIFPIVKQSLKPIEEHFQIFFTEIETIYVGLIFQSFLTNIDLSIEIRRPKAMVICENGISVSNLLYESLSKMFPMIHFIGNISVREFYDNPLIYRDISVIFSTSIINTSKTLFIIPPLLSETDKKVLQTKVQNTLFDIISESEVNIDDLVKVMKKNGDVYDEVSLRRDIRLLLSETIKEEKINILPKSNFNTLLTEERIKFTRRKFDFDEAIRAVSEPLLYDKCITKDYTEKIIHSYNEDYPYFVIAPGVAIPHASFNDGVKRIGLSMLMLEYPVPFSSQLEVSCILMVAPIDNHSHRNAIQAFYNLVKNTKEREELLSLKNSKSIKKFLMKKI
ncbi:BglG family transcription antiterminator [Enterococcus camelliae]|uniref:Ascorbate-specific PTS system EIIA component n=1 Tax=Enterococcus camelliae TaxID=453959 RepID=A0ABW5TJU3_9ENTE